MEVIDQLAPLFCLAVTLYTLLLTHMHERKTDLEKTVSECGYFSYYLFLGRTEAKSPDTLIVPCLDFYHPHEPF